MLSLNKIIKISAISLLLALIAFIAHPYFTALSFYQMKEVKIQTTQIGTEYNLRWIFAVVVAFIPLFYFAVEKFLNIEKTKETIFMLSAIVLSGVIFWQYKIISLQKRFEELNNAKSSFPIQYIFARENLNLEVYCFFGLFAGTIIGGIALYRFRKRNK